MFLNIALDVVRNPTKPHIIAEYNVILQLATANTIQIKSRDWLTYDVKMATIF